MKMQTPVNQEVQKELSGLMGKLSLIMMILGGIGLLAYIVLSVVIDDAWTNALLLFALPFGFGLVFFVARRSALKNAATAYTVNEYEFFEDHFTVASYIGGEVRGTSKVYYTQIIRVKQTERYLFLYISKTQAFPFLFSEFTRISEADPSIMQKLNFYI